MKKFCYSVLLLVVFVFIANSSNGISQVPRMLNYQGNLIDKNGTPLNGNIQATFKLFEIPSGGTEIWSETQNVKVDSGYFNVYLGSKIPLDNIPFNSQYYLEITVNNQAAYGRVPLITSPYSFRAIYTDTSNYAKVALSVADGAVTLNSLSSSVKTLGGDLIGTLPNPRIKPSAIMDAIPDHSIGMDKLSNSVSFPPTGAAYGDLTGTYPDPIIAPGAVKTDRIFDGAVVSSKILDRTIANLDLGLDCLTGSIPFSAVLAVTGNFRDVNSTNVTTGVSSSSISTNSPVGNLTTLNSSTANITNANIETQNVGTSSASISYSAPLANLTTVNSTNNNTSIGKINTLITSTISSTISITTPQANIGNANLNSLTTGTASATTSVTTPQANIGNANLNSLTTGTASATTSLTTPQANITNANISTLTAGVTSSTISVTTPQANIGNANLNTLTVGTSTSTLSSTTPQANATNANIGTLTFGTASATTSLTTPQASATNANINTLTVGTISSTVTNASGINSSGTITSGQGIIVTNGGANITGNTTVNGVYFVNGSSTFNGIIENINTVTNTGQVVNNNTVTSNADVLNKGNTIIGDAGSDGLTVNATATFNQNPRFNVGLNGISANLNTLSVGTASATTSITSPTAIFTNSSSNSESSNVLTTGVGSATVSFTSPLINTTDLYVRTIHESTPLAVSDANFTNSVNAPTLNATTGTVGTLNFTTATGTSSVTAPTITSSTQLNSNNFSSTGNAILNNLTVNGTFSNSGTLTSSKGLSINAQGANISGNTNINSGTLTVNDAIKVNTGGINIAGGNLNVAGHYTSSSGSITLTSGGISAFSASFNTLAIGSLSSINVTSATIGSATITNSLTAPSTSFSSSTIGGDRNGLKINAPLSGFSTAIDAQINGTTALKVSDDGTTGRVVLVNGSLNLASANLGSDANLATAANIRNISIAIVSGSATNTSLPTLTANENGKKLYVINVGAPMCQIVTLSGTTFLSQNHVDSFIYIHGSGWYKLG